MGLPEEAPQRRPATDAEARALASGLRLRILRLTLDEALTNKEIAERVGRNPASVLHHVRTLVDTDEETWADVVSGKITTSSAAATGALSIAGDPQAWNRLRKIFSRNQRLAQAEATVERGPRLGADT